MTDKVYEAVMRQMEALIPIAAAIWEDQLLNGPKNPVQLALLNTPTSEDK